MCPAGTELLSSRLHVQFRHQLKPVFILVLSWVKWPELEIDQSTNISGQGPGYTWLFFLSIRWFRGFVT
jgi:pyrroline-5-carboxylate reductase